MLICHSCSKNQKNVINSTIQSTVCEYYWFGGELLAVDITPDSLRFLVNPQCDFVFRIESDSNKLILFWPPDNQCKTKDMFSLKFMDTKTPKEGSIFAEFQLDEDFKFHCKYIYQDWVDSINIVRGLYFPKSLSVKFPKSPKASSD